MAVRKDPRTGLWYFRTRVTHPTLKNKDGTPVEFRTQQTPPKQINSKKTAEQWERNWIAKMTADPKDAARLDHVTAVTVETAAKAYVQRLKNDPTKAESYWTRVEDNFFYHVLPRFQDRALASITAGELDEFMLELQNKPCRVNGKIAKKKREEGTADQEQEEAVGRKTLSDRTVAMILINFRSAFKLAYKKGQIGEVPAFPTPPKPSKKKPTYLDFEEANSTIAAKADNEDEQLALTFAIRCGARCGEQIAVRWEDITWGSQPYLTIRRAHKRSKNHIDKEGKPKGKDEHTVPLHKQLYKALVKAKERRFGDRPAKGRIFLQPDGKRMTHDKFTTVLEQALRTAEITKHVRWHDLRHTFGSHMVMKGISIYQVQAWMGHKSVTTTEIYAHLHPSAGQAAMREAEKEDASPRAAIDGPAPGDKPPAPSEPGLN